MPLPSPYPIEYSRDTPSIKFQHISPSKHLSPYIFAYAFLESPQGDYISRYQQLLPAGTITINFELQGQMKGFLPNNYGELTPSIYLVGQTTVPHGILPIEELLHLSIVFFPVGFYTIFGIPASEFTDKVIAVDNVWGKEWAWLEEQLIEATDHLSRVNLLNNFLLKQLQIRGIKPFISDKAIAFWKQFPAGIHIKETTQHLKISERHFRRKFKEEIGITPKMYLRLKRFHQSLNLIKNTKTPDLSKIIYDCGYFDHAHFSKEFKTFTKLSPREYFKQQGQNNNQIREEYVLWNGR
ncbi:MAG: helix-turn-helix domain-containing protein [Chitinophagales bacterium]|nr:helix-turn-helix domain-containing protein [Chitinophagales bacterium]